MNWTRILIGAGVGTVVTPGVGTVIGGLAGGLSGGSQPAAGAAAPPPEPSEPIVVELPPAPPTPPPAPPPVLLPPKPPPSSAPSTQDLGTQLLAQAGGQLESQAIKAAEGAAASYLAEASGVPVGAAGAAIAFIAYVDYKLITTFFDNSLWGPCGPPPVFWPMSFEFHDWLLRRDPGYASPDKLQMDLVYYAKNRYYENLALYQATCDPNSGYCSGTDPMAATFAGDVIELIPHPSTDPPPPNDRRWVFDDQMLKWLSCRKLTPADYATTLANTLRRRDDAEPAKSAHRRRLRRVRHAFAQ